MTEPPAEILRGLAAQQPEERVRVPYSAVFMRRGDQPPPEREWCSARRNRRRLTNLTRA